MGIKVKAIERNVAFEKGKQKWAIYAAAVGGAFGAFLLLTRMFGGGLSLPRYTDISFGKEELIWAVPLILVGAVAGWLFRIFDAVFSRISELAGDRPVAKAVTAGVILGLCGMALPFVMFSGEVQADELNATWAALSAAVLVATGFVKIAATALCVNMGWRGGHFFPTVFAGISIGYGMASVLGIDPVFCVCAVTAAVVGGVVRRPLMAVLLLFLCFPLHSVKADTQSTPANSNAMILFALIFPPNVCAYAHICSYIIVLFRSAGNAYL